MYQPSLSRRIFITNIILVAVPLFIIGIIGYYAYTGDLKKSTEQYQHQILTKLEQQTDDYFTQLDNMLVTLWLQGNVQRLSDLPPEEWRNETGLIYALSRYMTNLFSARTGSEGIFLLTTSGGVYHELTKSFVRRGYPFQEQPYFKDSEHRRRAWVSGPAKQDYSGGSLVFSLNRSLLLTPELKWRGVIRYDINADEIYRLIEATEPSENGYYAVVDEEGRIIYHPNRDKIGEAASLFFDEPLLAMNEGHIIGDVEGRKSLSTIVTSEVTGWQMIGIAPYDQLMAGAYAVRNLFAGVACATLLLGVIVIARLNRSLLGPLHRLNHSIKRLGAGNMSTQVEVPRIVELQTVTVQYNETVRRLKRLQQDLLTTQLAQKEALIRYQEAEIRQRDAELSQLQAQINPHFLYNTLSSIDSMAEEQGVSSINQAIKHLSRMLRYSVSTGQKLVSLREEIQQAQSYVALQQLRHGHRISVIWDIDPACERATIIRLTLQPLIENAYEHGLEPSLEGGTIHVCAKIANSQLVLEVSDNGEGMEEETLQELQRFIRSPAYSETIDATKIRFSGLRNVIRRLFLAYGEDCVADIASSEGEGTRIVIALPLS
ncbi:cache domain-containing sensor histidine kinase [Paenibacillus chungangensis]|uniref:histidine kinase n=1 Tax=Paenibacillus chungangensis TaxID=696535 RepID=A0ABW3HSW0_9BACL